MGERRIAIDGVTHIFPDDFTDDEIASALGHGPTAPAPVERGGVFHPLTSLAAPELEAARSRLETATAVPHGQPVMARSRTGALYPSETGTGAVNAGKAFVGGAGGAALDQLEGATSPLGVAAATLSALPLRTMARGTAQVLEAVPSMRRSVPFVEPVTQGLRTFGTPPNLNDVPLYRQMEQMGDWPTAPQPITTRGAAPPYQATPPTGPHLDLSRPIQAGSLTQEQIGQRIAAAKAQNYQPPPRIPKPMITGRLQMAPDAAATPIAPPPTAADAPSLPESWKPFAQPETATASPTMGRPRIMTLKETPTSWTPEAARARLEMNDWHTGATPGTADAARAASSHRFDAELRSRMQYMLDNPKGAIALGAGGSFAEMLRRAVMAKLAGDPNARQ